MYRGVIQHRLYVTSFLRKQIEERKLEEPRALGRIWRIAPDGAPKANFKALALARASSSELVARLGDANGWTRDTAQRLLVERRDPAAARELTATAVDPQKPALARLHALWTLEGAKALDRSTVLVALADADARVCAAAIRLAENFFKQPDGADLIGRVAAKARTDPTVRLQLALSLGEAGTPAADSALLSLIVEAGRQPYLADAVVSGLAGREADFVEALAKEPAAAARGADALRFASSAALKSGNVAQIDRVLAVAANDATPAWARSAVLSGVRLFLPKAPDGRKVFPGSLPAEPKPLVALAAKESTAGATAKQLLAQLKWPGKSGGAEVAVRPLTADEQALFAKGKAQFATLCATCHQPNGQGLAGLAPSLLYSRWVLGDPRILSRIVLCGKVQENLTMPPWKAALDDDAIAGVLTFVRRSWGHDADPITPAIVADARKETAKRDEPWSDADLEDLVQSLAPATK
jgi:mono/diheme cytochrome c family protein